jgi:LacI family transcriptional regulator/LacI family fructose operon transcriptional repressor
LRVTLQNIADKIGLSRSAISRALRDDPRMSVATRKKIHLLAQEMGYRPSAIMSEIASSRWQNAKATEASVIAYVDRTQRAGHRGAPVDFALSTQAQLLGYRLEIFRREEFGSSAKLQRLLRNRGITEIILGPVFEESLQVTLDWSKFICIQLLAGQFQLPLHNVVRDHFNGVVLAWQKAVSRGYQRVGAVLFDHQPNRLADDVLRISAVHACQTEYFPHLAAIPPLRFKEYDWRDPTELVAWVKANEPDVIIGFSDVHFYTFRAGFGFDTPYVSLHHGDLHTRRGGGDISGIRDDAPSCAREAINLLHFCRRAYQWGIPERRIDHVIEPTWYEGTTLPPKTAG